MYNIIWLRHAEKEYANGKGPNHMPLFDPPILKSEEKKIDNTGAVLIANYGPPTDIFTSPYRRARETAILLKDSVKKHTDIDQELLTSIRVDCNVSEYLGFQKDKIYTSKYLVDEKTDHFINANALVKESISSLEKRIKSHLNVFNLNEYFLDVNSSKINKNIWVVTHGYVITQIFKELCKIFNYDSSYLVNGNNMASLDGISFNANKNIIEISLIKENKVIKLKKNITQSIKDFSITNNLLCQYINKGNDILAL